MMYCFTTDGFLYPLTKALAITAVDNGAKLVKVTLKWGK